MNIKIDPDGALGMILTFLSVASLLTLAIVSIAFAIYAAFWLGSVIMMGCIFMLMVALPLMWLEKTK